jgi:hypothetical protein
LIAAEAARKQKEIDDDPGGPDFQGGNGRKEGMIHIDTYRYIL